MHGHRKISILDGGLHRWEEDNYRTTSDIPEIRVNVLSCHFYNNSIGLDFLNNTEKQHNRDTFITARLALVCLDISFMFKVPSSA